jgi:hypothetical protein
MLIGEGSFSDDLFKMNIMTIETMVEKSNNNIFFSYLLESCDMWYDMLSYVNYNSRQRLINLNLLPTISFEKNHKCEFV